MRYQIIIIAIISLSLTFSCSQSKHKLAEKKLKSAILLCNQNDTTNALLVIDTLLFLFPEEFEVVTKAKELSKRLNSEILFRKQDYRDKLNTRFEELEKLFEKEKTEDERYFRYIHKLQKFERRWDKSFIQLHLNEKGDIYMSSNYYGADWLNHVAIRVYDGVYQAKSDTVSLENVNNHRSDFMNMHWEKVSYKNAADNGVISFIADNIERNLKAVFLGKRMYYIVLESYDKQAIKDGLELSGLIKKLALLDKEIKQLQAKAR